MTSHVVSPASPVYITAGLRYFGLPLMLYVLYSYPHFIRIYNSFET